MRKYNLKSVTDCELIFAYNDTVILSGKNPWIFRQDGTFVAKMKAIHKAYEIAFLPENMVLMDGLADQNYHYVSIDSGEILWSIPKKCKRSVTPNQFAVTPNGQVVYYVYQADDVLCVDRITIEEKSCTTYTIPTGLCATHHCYCDSEGELLLLQSFQSKERLDDGSLNSTPYLGVLKWTQDSPSPIWKYLWRSDFKFDFFPSLCNDEYVLFNNLTAKSFKNGEIINLLENNKEINRGPGLIQVSAYDATRKLLTVRFTHSWSTIIIDCNARKIVSHYAPISRGLSGGCLIGNEFWIGTFDGVVKRPFPYMDDFPRRL